MYNRNTDSIQVELSVYMVSHAYYVLVNRDSLTSVSQGSVMELAEQQTSNQKVTGHLNH